MLATLMFDVEESFYPPHFGLDDFTAWMADRLGERGLTGSFYFHGDHARILGERGNRAVARSMERHAVASHAGGNAHPLLPQLLEKTGWADGLEAVARYEAAIARDLQRVLGQAPQALSRHHFMMPQHLALAGKNALPQALPHHRRKPAAEGSGRCE